jgi:hypothetical protein
MSLALSIKSCLVVASIALSRVYIIIRSALVILLIRYRNPLIVILL